MKGDIPTYKDQFDKLQVKQKEISSGNCRTVQNNFLAASGWVFFATNFEFHLKNYQFDPSWLIIEVEEIPQPTPIVLC